MWYKNSPQYCLVSVHNCHCNYRVTENKTMSLNHHLFCPAIRQKKTSAARLFFKLFNHRLNISSTTADTLLFISAMTPELIGYKCVLESFSPQFCPHLCADSCGGALNKLCHIVSIFLISLRQCLFPVYRQRIEYPSHFNGKQLQALQRRNSS